MRDKEDKEESKPVFTPGMFFQDVAFEQIGEGSFIEYNRLTGQTGTRSFIIHDGLEYRPIRKLPWPSACLPVVAETEDTLNKEQLVAKLKARSFNGEYGDSERLFNEVKEFWMRHVDVSNPLLYDVFSAFTLMTWRIEDFKVVPYLFYLGPMASGKSRALEILHFLCYRAIMASSVSAAVIFRVLEAWHPTLLLDEAEVYNREGMIEVLALLNAGYRKGQVALRMEKMEDGNPTIGFFDTFGPKALAGTQELADTLQSRSILTHMTKNTKHVELFVDEAAAQDLRNKLLMYRFRNRGVSSEFDVCTLNGAFSNSRVIELFVSLLQVAPTEEIRNRLIECMKGITQTRFDEEQVSIEAQVFEAILNSEDKIDSGKLSIRTVTERFNLGLPEKEQGTARFIGRRVSALGFEKCKLSGGLRGFYWNADLVERLKARYYPSKSTPQTPQTQLTPLITVTDEQKQGVPSGISGVRPSMLDVPGESQNDVESGVCGVNGVCGISLEALAKSTLSLQRLNGLFEDKCVVCCFQGALDWQVNKLDGTYGLLCDQCGLELEKRLNKNEQ
jgi:hypothetical protein